MLLNHNMDWKFRNVPAQKGKVAIVTGANSGLGFETTKALVEKQVEVVMACRNLAKAKNAKQKILDDNPNANLELMKLDLADLASVKQFAENFKTNYDKLDFLVNNAGLMMPAFGKTKDGFEQQFQINYLGHFLLTDLLFPLLKKSKDARTVQLSSLAHKWTGVHFSDLQFANGYGKREAYGQSKLCCLIFGYELQRRLDSTNFSIKSFTAHPGLSNTNLMRHLPKWLYILAPVMLFLVQSSKGGARPILRALFDENLKGGEYLGPSGFKELKGKPKVVNSSEESKNKKTAKRLWAVSEELCGERFEVF